MRNDFQEGDAYAHKKGNGGTVLLKPGDTRSIGLAIRASMRLRGDFIIDKQHGMSDLPKMIGVPGTSRTISLYRFNKFHVKTCEVTIYMRTIRISQ